MILNIFLIVIIVLAVLVLLWVIWKKLPQLKILDPQSLADDKTKGLKHEIIRKRVERSGSKHLETVKKQVLNPAGSAVQNFVRRVAGKLTAVERRYQEKQRQTGEVVLDKVAIQELIDEGEKLMEEEAWDRAEKKLIEVIGVDAKNVEAYELLGRLYLYKKDLPLAKETFEFLAKLSKDDPSVIAIIGEVETMLGEHAKAFKHFQQAVELSPKNPKYLDFLISSAIENKDVHEATSTLDRLREVNPENKKIELFEKRIAAVREATK